MEALVGGTVAKIIPSVIYFHTQSQHLIILEPGQGNFVKCACGKDAYRYAYGYS